MSLLIKLACVALAIYIIKNVASLMVGLFTGAAISVFGFKMVRATKQAKTEGVL